MIRSLAVVLGGLLLGSCLILVGFFGNLTANTLKFEAAKALLQLGVVSVIGAIISLLTFEYQRRRQQDDKERELRQKNLEYREELLKSTLTATMKAYSLAKKARRLIRARAIVEKDKPHPIVLRIVYDQYMDMVNDGQLDIENLARDIETSERAFTESKSLVSHLQSIGSYLGKLIKEYERVRRTFEGDEPAKQLSGLPLLKDFIDSSKEGSRFMKEVVDPYHEVQKRIREDLLHPRFADLPSSNRNKGD